MICCIHSIVYNINDASFISNNEFINQRIYINRVRTKKVEFIGIVNGSLKTFMKMFVIGFMS